MSDLQVTSEDGVLRLHIDREAKRNALSGEVLRPSQGAGRDGHRPGAVDVREVLDHLLRDPARPDDAPADVHACDGMRPGCADGRPA